MNTLQQSKPMQRILVVGGAGYIGSALLPKLLNQGYKVRLLDRLLFGTEPIAHLLDHPNLELTAGDFRQVHTVIEAMSGIDAVIHLGALVGDPACELDEMLTIEINLMATRMIAAVSKSFGVRRFVFASTCSVYGTGDHILTEESALNPISLYARTKIASEKVLHDLASPHFAPTFLRFGTIYGISGRTRFDLVVNLMTAKALLDEEIIVFGGDQWRPFLHVDDAALAIFKVLEAPLALVHSQVFNVGSVEQNLQIIDAAQSVHRMIPTARLVIQGTEADRRNYRVDFAKIQKVLDFVPRWSIQDGIKQVAQAIQSGYVVDYREPRYSNVKSLKEDGIANLLRDETNRWAFDLIQESPAILNAVAHAKHRHYAMDAAVDSLPHEQIMQAEVAL